MNYCSECSVNPTVHRGLCGWCYENWRLHGTDRPRCTSRSNCGRPVYAKGFCNTHYSRLRTGGDPHSAIKAKRPRHRASSRNTLGQKECSVCREWLDVSAYAKAGKLGDGLQSLCRQCASDRHLRQTYGLTRERYNSILEAQCGGCALCGDSDDLVVDHNHACCPGMKSCGDCVRSILCRHCNTALGLAKDSPDLLVKMANYLSSPTIERVTL